MKPFVVIAAGIFVEYWVVTIISSTTKSESDKSPKEEIDLAQTMDKGAGNPSSTQAPSNSTDTTPSTTWESFKSWCISAFKMALKIWQIISALTILSLDIMALVEYVKDHPDQSGWTQYSCYVQICTNSANYKTLIVNMYLMHTHVQNAKKGTALFLWRPLIIV